MAFGRPQIKPPSINSIKKVGGATTLPSKVALSPAMAEKVRSGIKPKQAGMDFSQLDRTKKPTSSSSDSKLIEALQGKQSQATGNRTYNGFAPSPHAGGGLAKAGYQKRDQTAKNKKSFLMNRLKSGGF